MLRKLSLFAVITSAVLVTSLRAEVKNLSPEDGGFNVLGPNGFEKMVPVSNK